MQAIQAGTRVNAELLQKKDIGTIQPGKYADIIAVAKNPLQGISELERVKFVMLGGKIVLDDITE
jgi:imidazolonepropionase-like amidohydrolase